MVPENIHTHPRRIFGNSKVEGGLKDIFLKESYPAGKRFHPLLLSERLVGTFAYNLSIVFHNAVHLRGCRQYLLSCDWLKIKTGNAALTWVRHVLIEFKTFVR